MKAAVRYYSRGGNVRAMAEAFARGAQVEALSVEDPAALIDEPIDVLFIGGALYAYRLDKVLIDYLEAIPDGLVGRAVCFGSSYLTRRPVYLIQEQLKKHGIAIVPQAVYSRNRPKQTLLDACEYFAAKEIERDTSLDGLSPYERFRAMRIATGDVSVEDELRSKPDEDTSSHPADIDGEIDESSAVATEKSESLPTGSDQASVLINVDGINAAFRDQVIEIVEAIPDVSLHLVELPDTLPSSLVFGCDTDHDVDDLVPLIKGTLKHSELGNIMLFRVTPHGEVMWVPKKH